MSTWTTARIGSFLHEQLYDTKYIRICQKFGNATGLLASNSPEAVTFAEQNHKGFMTYSKEEPAFSILAYFTDDIHVSPPGIEGMGSDVFLYKKGMTYPLQDAGNSITVDELGRIHLVDGNRHLLVLSKSRKDDIRHPARILRELLSRRTCSQSVRIHGGAAVFPEGGCLILGNKGAGKTTLLTSLLGTQVSYCANDRVVVGSEHNDTLTIFGLPVTVRLGLGTRRADHRFSNLSGGGIDHSFVYRDINILNVQDDKIELTPFEYCRIVGCKIQGRAPLRAVIIPELDIHHHSWEIADVQEEHKEQLLQNNLLHPDPAFPHYFDSKEWPVNDDVYHSILRLPWLRIRGSFHHNRILKEIQKKVFYATE